MCVCVVTICCVYSVHMVCMPCNRPPCKTGAACGVGSHARQTLAGTKVRLCLTQGCTRTQRLYPKRKPAPSAHPPHCDALLSLLSLYLPLSPPPPPSLRPPSHRQALLAVTRSTSARSYPPLHLLPTLSPHHVGAPERLKLRREQLEMLLLEASSWPHARRRRNRDPHTQS